MLFFLVKNRLILFLFFLPLLKSQIAEITITDSKVIVYSQAIYLDENSPNKTTQVLNLLEYSGKLCFGNDNKTVDKCIDLYEPYNKNWVLLVSNENYFASLAFFINWDKYARIKAVLANNDTIEASKAENVNYPLFWVNQKEFDEIAKYNIVDERENYFATLTYQSNYFKLLNRICFNVIVVMLFITVGISLAWIVWMYRLRQYIPGNIQTIQSLLKYFSYLKAIIALVYVYYFSSNTRGSTKGQSTLIQAYISVILMALESINISVSWILLLIIATGWFLYKIEFNHTQAIRLTIGYIIFFSLVVFDKVIDMVISPKVIANLTFSDMKNLVLYTILIGVCQKLSLETLLQLRKKYTYAYHYSVEFMQPLKLKVSLIKRHLAISIAYWMLTVIHIALVKSLIQEETAIQVIWAVFDLSVFVSLLIVYRPRKFSQFYFIYEEHNEEEQFLHLGAIYKFKCTLETLRHTQSDYTHLISDEAFDKNELQMIQSAARYPIIVLHQSSTERIMIGFCYSDVINSNSNNYSNSLISII